ncbi:hypothetical protein GSI_13382 [Ganoderma sinense ZZ0214-1]|uniref:Uncharacterized protein n=1 Tax=Ganoderma sinense ZZ0214-1 TaxID=1077348 RepID=A0A2G8RVF2_9APHY|nr:hypothetical protein GSI_13382 [Ganoderma sinense ZZ0214-1]
MALDVLPNISVLVSIWMETLFYGMYVVLFFSSMYVLVRSRKKLVHGWVIRTALCLMFCISTAHIAVNLRRLIEGFINPDTKAETLKYLYDIHQPLNIVKQYLWVFNNVLADGIIVWRLYTLWDFYVCIIPILMLLATTAFGLATATSLLPSVGAGNTIFISHLSRFATTQYALSLTNNVLVTALIAGRIWHTTRALSAIGRKHTAVYRRAILIMIESGALYAFTQIIQLSWYVAKFPGLYFVADSFVQIMVHSAFLCPAPEPVLTREMGQAIAPTLVVLLVALGRTAAEEAQGTDIMLASMKFTSGHTKSSRTLDADSSALTAGSSPKESAPSSGLGPRSPTLFEETA